MKVIFLDRDGIVNTELGDYVMNMEDFEIHQPIIPFLKEATKMGFSVVIITNQAGIAKGLYGHDLVKEQHDLVKNLFNNKGIHLLEAYYCPHHPDFGECLCRKPKSLLIEKAIARFGIDRQSSLMIGDKLRDVEAANGAGVKGYQVESNPSFETLMSLI